VEFTLTKKGGHGRHDLPRAVPPRIWLEVRGRRAMQAQTELRGESRVVHHGGEDWWRWANGVEGNQAAFLFRGKDESGVGPGQRAEFLQFEPTT